MGEQTSVTGVDTAVTSAPHDSLSEVSGVRRDTHHQRGQGA
jgi:hypothetical protein